VGYLLARASFMGKWGIEGLVNLPLVLPPVPLLGGLLGGAVYRLCFQRAYRS